MVYHYCVVLIKFKSEWKFIFLLCSVYKGTFYFIFANFLLSSLGPLVCKVKEYQVEWIVDTLCTNMASNKEQLRDISSIGILINDYAYCLQFLVKSLSVNVLHGEMLKMLVNFICGMCHSFPIAHFYWGFS